MTGPVQLGATQVGQIPWLRDADASLVAKLAPSFFDYRFETGEAVLREGEYCDGVYYITDGLVEVRFARGAVSSRAPGAPTKKPSLVARLRNVVERRAASAKPKKGGDTAVLPELSVDLQAGDKLVLGPGEIIGEGSALSRYPVATDIVAITPVRCVFIRSQALRLMFNDPEFEAFRAFFDVRYRDRTLKAHLRRVPILEGLDKETLDEIAAGAELVRFKPDRVIAEQGTPSDAMFLVRGGYVKVGLRVGDNELTVGYLRKGDFVGEAGLLLAEPWPYILTALEHVELVKVSRSLINDLIRRRPELEGRLWESMTSLLQRRNAAAADPVAGQYLQYALESGLIHGESVLLIDLETCTRCDECVRACADVHDGVPRFVREGARFRNFSVPTACYQCTDPVCMIGCPTGAITRPLGTFEVAINSQTCIGCGTCVRNCPWDNILTIPFDSPATGRRIDLATKCDLCIGRDDGPACVQMCPHGAAVRVSFKDAGRLQALLSRDAG